METPGDVVTEQQFCHEMTEWIGLVIQSSWSKSTATYKTTHNCIKVLHMRNGGLCVVLDSTTRATSTWGTLQGLAGYLPPSTRPWHR